MEEPEVSRQPSNASLDVLGRLRRNHALEHATMHMLSAKLPARNLVGRATPGGFVIYGEAPTDAIIEAAREGLRRLQAGQRQLAVHPNCGTSLVLSGIMAGLGAFLILNRKTKSLWERILLLPLACAAATLGIMASRPLGPLVQAWLSTASDVQGLRITGANRTVRAGVPVHTILTTS